MAHRIMRSKLRAAWGRTRQKRGRRPYHHGNLRNALIDAAAAVVDLHGLSALTLREAARRAGVSHNAPYRHFRDRAGLIAAVAADGFHMLIEDLELASAMPERERAGALARAYVRFAEDNPGRFAVMFGQEARAYANETTLSSARAALEETLAHALGTKRAGALWAAMHGLAALAQAGHLDAEDAAEAIVLAPIL
jgi:AcrR family transcriptional regulator